MKLNKMLNKKLENEKNLIEKVSFCNNNGEDVAILNMNDFEGLDLVKEKLESSMVFYVEQVGIQLWVYFDKLFIQMYLDGK